MYKSYILLEGRIPMKKGLPGIIGLLSSIIWLVILIRQTQLHYSIYQLILDVFIMIAFAIGGVYDLINKVQK
jgi:hypothetical protein